MKRATLLLALLIIPVIPAAAMAQAQSPPVDPERQTNVAPVKPEGTDARLADLGPTQVRPPVPTYRSVPRRRGSMVGYIDDATVDSRIRVRFESGWHNHFPDRAEFFYAKCGCYRDLAGNPNYDPDAPGPGPGIVTDLNFQQFYVQAEYSGGGRVSVFAELPTRSIKPQAFASPASFSNQSGLGDLRAGAKIGLLAAPDRAVTLQVKGFLPTGKAENGLGTHHVSLEPTLLAFNTVNDRVTIESQAGLWLPFNGSQGLTSDDKFSGNIFFYGIGPSVEVYRNGSVALAPVVELVGWHVLGGLQTTGSPGVIPNDDATGTNIVNLKIGARVTWSPQSSFYVGWGHALTTASWYENILRFEYRFSF